MFHLAERPTYWFNMVCEHALSLLKNHVNSWHNIFWTIFIKLTDSKNCHLDISMAKCALRSCWPGDKLIDSSWLMYKTGLAFSKRIKLMGEKLKKIGLKLISSVLTMSSIIWLFNKITHIYFWPSIVKMVTLDKFDEDWTKIVATTQYSRVLWMKCPQITKTDHNTVAAMQ